MEKKERPERHQCAIRGSSVHRSWCLSLQPNRHGAVGFTVGSGSTSDLCLRSGRKNLHGGRWNPSSQFSDNLLYYFSPSLLTAHAHSDRRSHLKVQTNESPVSERVRGCLRFNIRTHIDPICFFPVLSLYNHCCLSSSVSLATDHSVCEKSLPRSSSRCARTFSWACTCSLTPRLLELSSTPSTPECGNPHSQWSDNVFWYLLAARCEVMPPTVILRRS